MRLFPEIAIVPQFGPFPTDAYALRWVLRSVTGREILRGDYLPTCAFRAGKEAAPVPTPPWSEAVLTPGWAFLEVHATHRARGVTHRLATFHAAEAPEIRYGVCQASGVAAHVSLCVHTAAHAFEFVRDGSVVVRAVDAGDTAEPVTMNPEHLNWRD